MLQKSTFHNINSNELIYLLIINIFATLFILFRCYSKIFPNIKDVRMKAVTDYYSYTPLKFSSDQMYSNYTDQQRFCPLSDISVFGMLQH